METILNDENLTLKRELEEMKKEVKKYKDILLKGKVKNYVFESLYSGGDINICALNGEITQIPVTHLTNVLEVKKKIEMKKHVPIARCELCFGGSRGSSCLENHRSLFYYNICVGSTLHLILKDETEKTHILIVNDEHNKEMAFDGYDIRKATKRLLEQKNYKNMNSKNPKLRKGWTGKISEKNVKELN